MTAGAVTAAQTELFEGLRRLVEQGPTDDLLAQVRQLANRVSRKLSRAQRAGQPKPEAKPEAKPAQRNAEAPRRDALSVITGWKRKITMRKVLVVVAACLFVIAMLSLTACAGAEAGEPAPAPTSSVSAADKLEADKAAATEACKGFVENQLKAPATAQFVGVEATLHGVDTYDVLGGVDSENGFGALIRSTFSCTTQLSPSTGEDWIEVSVNVF